MSLSDFDTVSFDMFKIIFEATEMMPWFIPVRSDLEGFMIIDRY